MNNNENKFIQKFNNKWNGEWTYIEGYSKYNSKITIQHKCGTVRTIQADNAIRKSVDHLTCECDINNDSSLEESFNIKMAGKFKYVKRLELSRDKDKDTHIIQCLECGAFLERKGKSLYNIAEGYKQQCKCESCMAKKKHDKQVMLRIANTKKAIQDDVDRVSETVRQYERLANSFGICEECGEIYYNTATHSKYCEKCRLEKDRDKRRCSKYTNWRDSVFARDNYTCQCCGDNKGGNLNAHHMNSYDEYIDERYEINNGITLCEKCHKMFHEKYGYGGNTREQFEKFLIKS